ncbi:uncharacterized protein LOC143301881 [Babylonia areolata]|uniref:uncharacterized protein LOC143301881 n=1 Tax=Babylonia areolata TaxID=304850 RepID=UPI003FD41E8E
MRSAPHRTMITRTITTGCLTPNSHGQLLVVALLVSSFHCSSTEVSRETVHDDPFVVYPYRLLSTSPFGRIPDSALPGSEVLVDSSLPHFEATDHNRYLTLKLLHNDFYVDEETSTNNTGTNVTSSSKQHKPGFSSKGSHPSKSNGTTGDKKPFKGGALWPLDSLLPDGVRIDISGEKGNIAKISEKMAFTLDENLHIVVGTPDHFKDVDGIEFWVVAIQQEEGRRDRVVSNPLSFVIKIDHSAAPSGHGAPVYAGIVVLVVCLFALLIPLTVRTKRRLREGKPLCVCGSSSKKLQERQQGRGKGGQRQEREMGKAETGSVTGTGSDATGTGSGVAGTGRDVTGTGSVDVPTTTRKASLTADSRASAKEYDNLAMILEGRQRLDTGTGTGTGATERRASQTIQSRNLRSVSEHHFQPHWLDPHYKDVYERPVFRAPQHVPPAPAHAPASVPVPASAGSSSSSSFTRVTFSADVVEAPPTPTAPNNPDDKEKESRL